ncbi:M24 family metallopeptidase, partial [Escherichia coli]|nr:M24 family metallopeptidase [Escherichia coli]
NEADLNPNVENRNRGPRKPPEKNLFSDKQIEKLEEIFRAGMFEYQLEGEILHEFNRHGARFPSYNTIVGGGENGCILHYTENESELRDGDLVLIDAGCEYRGYAGDITRTFPVNGK